MQRHTPSATAVLRSATVNRLRFVLLAGWRAAPDMYEGFRATIAAAVEEARAHGHPPEWLIVVIKAMERDERLVPFESNKDGITRSDFHDWIVRVVVEHYYGRIRHAPSDRDTPFRDSHDRIDGV